MYYNECIDWIYNEYPDYFTLEKELDIVITKNNLIYTLPVTYSRIINVYRISSNRYFDYNDYKIILGKIHFNDYGDYKIVFTSKPSYNNDNNELLDINDNFINAICYYIMYQENKRNKYDSNATKEYYELFKVFLESAIKFLSGSKRRMSFIPKRKGI
jgi:hypothetical protein